MEDSTIVKKIIDRDDTAIADVMSKYGKYVRTIARGILSDERDAEECANDAVLKAWENIPQTAPDDLKSYLGMLTRNACISRKRLNSAGKRGGDAEFVSDDEIGEIAGNGTVSETAEAAELGRLISRFLRERDAAERNLFIRRYWYGDRISDIAAAFGMSESAVKMKLKRTRDRLAALLKKEGYVK